MSDKDKEKWYPGKYLVKAVKGSGNTPPKEPGKIQLNPEYDQTEIDGSMLDSEYLVPSLTEKSNNNTDNDLKDEIEIKNRKSSSSGWFTSSKNNQEKDSDTETESDSGDKKKEAMIAKTVRGIRNKVINRKLDAIILIKRTSGIISTSIQCKVNASDIASDENEDFSNISASEKQALGLTDTILHSLENRAMAWDSVDFNAEVTLTRGGTIGISDPLLGLFGWSITIEISATVKSLIAAKKASIALNLIKKAEIAARKSTSSFML